ncbi:MAG: sensor domain-containing protein [Mycobacterium sp.]|uniref:sensor domain-containing protein n=1 Tax=Mycobacterium sp. TaxID=1785 RepID=UPI003F9DCE95
MRQQIAGLALAGVCTFAAGCSATVDGKALRATAADKSGPVTETPVEVSALDGLLLDASQINSELSANSMKVWFSGKVMWDWSTTVSDTNCLAIDGPAQDKVYANTGWTAIRGQRLDDSVDDSKERKHYAIQAVIAFPSAHDASAFYDTSTQTWPACSNRRFSDLNPGKADTVWSVSGTTNDNGMLTTSQVQEGGDGWTCQRALTVRNNVAIDIVTCSYRLADAVAVGVAQQIATKVAKQ